MAGTAPPPPDASGKARRRYAPRLPPEQRREQLLDAALSVILDQGYSGVSIEAVARLAGVTRPVVYDHFANLGLLLYALIEREERYALDQLREVVPAEPGEREPVDVLPESFRRFLDAVATRPATWRLILLPPEGTPALVREHVQTNRRRILEQILALVQWAQRRPELPNELDPEMTARAILALAEEAGRMVLIDSEVYSPARYEQFVAQVTRLIWPAV
jgi:AcrR family transcriptional regulator